MKKLIKGGCCSVGFFLLFNLSQSLAATTSCRDDCHIDVLFKGEYLAETCRLTINQASSQETILLPELSTSQFTAQENELGMKPFTIQLTECPEKQSVLLSMHAENAFYDALTGNLKNTRGTGMSENVQVRIRKENGEQLKINQVNTGQTYQYANGKNIETHQFTASYYSVASLPPTPGKLMVRATININYP
ncbi:Pilin (type 1 fimbria component protein) [Rosenbergiella nectarea]|uniref:Pilin (Type 1 fimbria component protein) n=1 Tax=Rosenbergiella nectarea TaxID=988801 RepID=A0A1H9IQN2_9GAMM|nr:fimbrial protein [Rosenbergiella nectarea]SEQ76827.1 Pilin (type 1 fimbria component protein) [Rosenbergiella nectarea]